MIEQYGWIGGWAEREMYKSTQNEMRQIRNGIVSERICLHGM